DLLLRAEPGAARAGAVRRVEGEDPGLELGQRDAVVRARELLAEQHRLPVDDVDSDQSVGELRGGLDRLREARSEIGLHHEAVDDDLDRVLVLLVERDLFLEQAQVAIDLHAGEPFAAELLEDVLELPFAVAHDRGVDSELRSVGKLEDLVDDRLEALAGDWLAANRAVGAPDARVEETEVVVDLGDRADGRARVA